MRVDAQGKIRPRVVTRFEEAAHGLFVAWHDENAAALHAGSGPASGWAAKYPRQLARLALVLQALHHPEEPTRPVSPAMVEGAIALVEYFRAHLARVLVAFGQPGITSPAAGTRSRVLLSLRAAEEQWASRTELHQALGQNVAAAQLTAALDDLEREGLAERREVPTQGRPREEWRLSGNEQTKKVLADPRIRQAADPFFVSSFVRAKEDANHCCICGAALPLRVVHSRGGPGERRALHRGGDVMSRSWWRCRNPACPVPHGRVLGRVTADRGLVLAPAVQRFAAYLDTGRVAVTCPACGTTREFRGRAVVRD